MRTLLENLERVNGNRSEKDIADNVNYWLDLMRKQGVAVDVVPE